MKTVKVEEAPDYVTVRWDRGGTPFVGDLPIVQMPLIAYVPQWTDWQPSEPHDPRVKRKLIGFRLRTGYKELRNPPILLNFGAYGAIVFSNW